MTAQIPEILNYYGGDVVMCSFPLNQYFDKQGAPDPFGRWTTATRRGYKARWRLEEERLYLIELQGRLADGRPATVASLFPGLGGKVFAQWYTGALRLPQGKLLDVSNPLYHFGEHERDVFVDIESGVLKDVRVHHNARRAFGAG